MEQQNKPWVFITGGSRGLGRGIVLSLVEDYRVVFTYLNNSEKANEVESLAKTNGGEAIAIQCDGTDYEAVNLIAKDCIEQYGAPYAVINNAGITQDSLMISMDVESWRNVLTTNLDATFYVTQAFLPAMFAEKKGIVLLMSSVTAVKGNAGQVNYAATKSALTGIARTLALETARFKIRVNAIAPGLLETEMAENIPEKDRKKLEKSIPLRRLGKVSEVSSLVNYLLSESAAYITGQTIIIDGGLSA